MNAQVLLLLAAFLEFSAICCLLWLLSAEYFRRQRVLLLVAGIAAVVVLCANYLPTLPGRFASLVSFLLLMSAVVRRNIFFAAGEFALATSAYGIVESAVSAVSAVLLLLDIPQPEGETAKLFCVRLLLLCGAFLVGRSRPARVFVSAVYQRYQREWMLFAMNLLFIYLVGQYLWGMAGSSRDAQATALMLIVLAWILLSGFLLTDLCTNRQLKEMLRLQKQYAGVLRQSIHQLSAEKHEFNRHLQTISGYIEIEEPANAVESIVRYMADLKTRSKETAGARKLILTVNEDLNALLCDEQKLWEKSNVTIFCMAKGDLQFPLHSSEFIEVVGNLLRNACEQAAQLPIGERSVFLEVGESDSVKFISVKNKFDNEGGGMPIDLWSERGFSTKDGIGRGYGLYNVSRIAERRGGRLEMRREEDYFCTCVLFPQIGIERK